MTGRIVGSGEKTRYLLDNEEVTKEEFDRAFPDKPMHEAAGDGSGLIAWHRKVESDGAAVHYKQVPQAMERDRKHGVPTEYTPEDGEGNGGRPIFRSRGHRRAYLKSLGFHDNDGGYGDG